MGDLIIPSLRDETILGAPTSWRSHSQATEKKSDVPCTARHNKTHVATSTKNNASQKKNKRKQRRQCKVLMSTLLKNHSFMDDDDLSGHHNTTRTMDDVSTSTTTTDGDLITITNDNDMMESALACPRKHDDTIPARTTLNDLESVSSVDTFPDEIQDGDWLCLLWNHDYQRDSSSGKLEEESWFYIPTTDDDFVCFDQVLLGQPMHAVQRSYKAALLKDI